MSDVVYVVIEHSLVFFFPLLLFSLELLLELWELTSSLSTVSNNDSSVAGCNKVAFFRASCSACFAVVCAADRAARASLGSFLGFLGGKAPRGFSSPYGVSEERSDISQQ